MVKRSFTIIAVVSLMLAYGTHLVLEITISRVIEASDISEVVATAPDSRKQLPEPTVGLKYEVLVTRRIAVLWSAFAAILVSARFVAIRARRLRSR